MAQLPRRRWPLVLGGFVLLLVVGALLFRWDWLIPLVQARASAALGRTVTIEHLHLSLGRTTRIEADGLTISNPPDWPGGGTFATAQRLGIDVDAGALVRDRAVVLPVIDVQSPKVSAEQTADGKNNWTFATSSSDSSGPGVQLGTLRIADGNVAVKSAPMRADMQVKLETRDGDGGKGQIAADATGTYAGQPITAQFVGGALLSLRDAATPYPVDLKLANGPTRISLVGTVANPLAFAGTSLKLELAGPDMARLEPLIGLALPATPPYRVAGKLDYAAGSVKFTGIAGQVGNSDLEGDLAVDTKPERPVLTATLQSRLVDLKDLSGFIGGEPDAAKKGEAPASAPGRVLPNDPISLPKLNAADVHLDYHAKRIRGRAQPLDDMHAKLDIVNGDITLHPLAFGIGQGQIKAEIRIAQQESVLHAKADIDFNRVDVGKLLNATGIAKGAGTISGKAEIDGNGRTLAQILGFGNGYLRLFMGPGGNVSALLVDLAGFQFGKAVLSALGVPDRAILQCAAIDFSLQKGLATARTFLVDTDTARVEAKGWVSLNREMLGLVLETDSKHFSIGSLPTPIDIGGTFAKPSVLPQAGPLAVRGGAAVALGIVGTPLAALLPTIQFGTGEDGACQGMMHGRR